jgi:LacI family transcriptional regulator
MAKKTGRGKRNVTIVDVAKQAGVSIATVSRALSGRGYASPDVKERVRQAARQLNYRFNATARSLKVKRTNTIGLIITDITNPFYAYLASGVLDCAKEKGYHVVVCATNEDPQMEREDLNVLLEQRVDGIIAIPSGENRHIWQQVIDMNTGLVLIDREIPGLSQVDCVLVDNAKGAYLATKHLIELGHSRIGLMSGPDTTTTGKERRRGYVEALEDAGLSADPTLVQGSSFMRESGYLAVQALLALPQRPTAIFAANNVLGEAAVFALRERGLKIPADISLLMFDDVPWAAMIQPGITVISQPTYNMGCMSLKLLDQRLQEHSEVTERRTPVKVVMEPEFNSP